MEKKKTKNWKKIVLNICIALIYLLSYVILCVGYWGRYTFNTDIDGIIYTLTNPIKGTSSDVIKNALLFCLPRLAVFVLISVLIFVTVRRISKDKYLMIKTNKSEKTINIKALSNKIISIGSIIMLLFSFYYIDFRYDIVAYVKNQFSKTTIYEEYYIDPSQANISLTTEDCKQKNLIYIYLESMETTYASNEDGGVQQTNIIPNLTKLANENLSFSNTNKLGGFINTTGTAYTMGALLSTTSGVPFSFPVDMRNYQEFASGLVNLGDILAEFGYNQEFLCGSDGDFAGRKAYFQQHGNYKVFDLFSAREEGYIADDYYVWWGYEDKILYDIAKDELLELSSQDKPFNFTMLTVDTHFIEGYRCELCENNFDSETANIISCADKQIYNFINWCKQQDFFEDTIIVISGDHPRMDTYLVNNVSMTDRSIYNCFINCEQENLNTTNRIFTPMDMFPTVLSTLGFKWDGNRLGLGTNLFSSEETLAEELGFDYLNRELSKRSEYYIENFA